jgi:hypothetical protein
MTLVESQDRVAKLKLIWQHARNGKRNRYDHWTRNYRLVNNRMGGNAAESWMPAPRSSEIFPRCSTIVAWMLDQGSSITCGAATTPHSDYGDYLQTLAQDLGTVLTTNWDTNHFASQEKLCVWDGIIYGAGFLKSTWDSSMDDGLGNIMLKRISPWDLYFDPKATCLEDCEYIIEARRMSLDEIERRFPGNREALAGRMSSPNELDEKPSAVNDPNASPLLNLDTTKLAGGSPRSGPGDGRTGIAQNRNKSMPTKNLVVYEFWVKENDEYWTDKETDSGPTLSEKHVRERWRVSVVCDNEMLLDEYADDLWSHAKHPYSRFIFEDIGEMYGLALVDHLAYPQIYVNRLLTALQMNVELTGNPIFIESEKMGLSRQQVPNKPGTRVSMKGAVPGGQGNGPYWLQPPSMSPDSMRMVQFWQSSMDDICGISAMQKGSGSSTPQQGPARTTTTATNTAQEVGFVRIRSALANMEQTLEDAAVKLASLVIDNYDKERTMAIVGPQGEVTSIALKYRHFDTPSEHGAAPLKYSINVSAGSDQPTSLQGRWQREFSLFVAGVTDDLAFLQAINYPDYEDIVARKQQNAQQQSLGGAGGPPPGQQGSTDPGAGGSPNLLRQDRTQNLKGSFS